MRARIHSIADLRKAAGPFLGPKGGLWADPQHTIPWSSDKHGKVTPANCPRCKGLAHIVSRQTGIEGGESVSSAPCRTCNAAGKVAFDPKKAQSLGLPVPKPKSEPKQSPSPRKAPEQLSLLSYKPPPKQETLFRSEEALRKNLPVKERFRVHGLDVCIENPRGSVRHWYDPEKKQPGKTVMVHPYGFIRGAKGADGDDVDVFVGPDRDSKLVVIINQRRTKDRRRFDEHKVMLGFKTEEAAKEAYLRNYDKKGPQIMGSVRVWSIDRFKRWLEEGDTSEPAEKSLR